MKTLTPAEMLAVLNARHTDHNTTSWNEHVEPAEGVYGDSDADYLASREEYRDERAFWGRAS
jgi:hypothetical protein